MKTWWLISYEEGAMHRLTPVRAHALTRENPVVWLKRYEDQFEKGSAQRTMFIVSAVPMPRGFTPTKAQREAYPS